MSKPFVKLTLAVLFIGLLAQDAEKVAAADRLTGLHSAQVMSQSMPWIAQEAGLFKKYDLDFRLVFIPSSPVATAATLNGDAEIGVTGAIGNVRAYVQGFTDLVFIGGVKNFLTHSIVAKPDIKRPEDLKGKKVAVGRFGGNTHYFTIQALRKFGMDASKDIQTIQTGGGPETLAALIAGNVDAAGLVAPGDAAAVNRGYGYVINGFDLRIPYGATQFVTLRSVHQQTRPRDRTLHAGHGRVGDAYCTPTRISSTKFSANICGSPTRRFSIRRIRRKSRPWSGVWRFATRRCKLHWMKSPRRIPGQRPSSRRK